MLLHHVGSLALPCPADLFVGIVRISRLRFQFATNSSIDAVSLLQARKLFSEIDGCDLDYWATKDAKGNEEMVHMTYQIFQIAVRLFGILTLPRLAVAAAYSGASSLAGYNALCISQQHQLVKLLRQAFYKVQFFPALKWPLVVAGVGSAMSNESRQEQEFIGQCIFKIWQHPLTNDWSLDSLQKLQAFWISGETEWDVCFDQVTMF